MSAAGDKVRAASVLVDGQAVGPDAGDSVEDPELTVRIDFGLGRGVVV